MWVYRSSANAICRAPVSSRVPVPRPRADSSTAMYSTCASSYPGAQLEDHVPEQPGTVDGHPDRLVLGQQRGGRGEGVRERPVVQRGELVAVRRRERGQRNRWKAGQPGPLEAQDVLLPGSTEAVPPRELGQIGRASCRERV